MKTNLRNNLKSILFLTLIVFCFNQSFAQETEITGTVTTTTGEPIPFANILIKGTSQGTSADFDGIYSISAASDQILVFSYVGFKTLEVPVGDQKVVDVQLQEDVATLDEIVVVGYGTQDKKDLTSAISVVKSDQIQKRQTTTVAESLQGLATGVNVRGGGQPGQEAKIEIRGLKNLQNANPLYVIDGLVTTANRDFNPNDIESIQILKDAAAAAIYGSRAANGVIIITTKKGKQGPLQVSVSSKWSVTEVPRYDLAGQEEFVRLNNMAYDNAGIPRQDLNLDVNTDWQEEVFRTGLIQDQNVSFSGGGENSSYFMSGNYFGNKGTVIGTKFDRVSFRVNSSGTKGIFSIGENLALSNSKNNEIGGPEALRGNPFIDVVRLFPTIPVYDEDNPGGYGYGKSGVANTFAANPVAISNLIDQSIQNFRIRGNVWAELNPFPFLKYRASFGYETSFDNFKYLRKEGSWTLNQPYEASFTNQNRAQSQTKLLENTLTFTHDFGKHGLTVLAGTTYQKDSYEQINGLKRNLLVNPNTGEYFDVLDLGDQAQVGGFRNEASLLSYLGRLEYNYDDRYLLNAVFRRDGSSRFSDANKWSNFPSLSLAWRLSNESFFNIESISDLKLRASYGELGSGNIGNYEYQGFINTFGAIVLGTGQNLTPSATQVRLANSELQWETLKQTNLGLDLALFKNKLQITADYFIAKTENVLFGFPILLSTGNDGGNPIANAATVENKGFELNIAYNKVINNDLSFNASLNFTKLNNKLVKLGNGLNESIQGNTITRAGGPVGMWYVLQTDGLFQSQDEINNYTNSEGEVIQPGAVPGDIRFVDFNDDGEITNEDKSIVASPWPDFEMGFNAGVTYKDFDFSMNWIGSFGATVYNGYRSIVDRFDDDSNYRAGVQPWTPENPNTDFPRIVKGTTLNSRADSDRWLEDGSFARLKYIGLGYSLPQNTLEKIGFSKVRLSLSAQNIITITGYEGLDPEFSNSNIFQRGVDLGSYPNVQTYSLGVEFGF
ncbi:SusC/RagA family TonB-linked outer membrane protein [Leeuwenhoekiella blandensis]|uniref:Putative outer membrane protein, probably involved in nutrient binding n=1 Tax=Leeuwenhoekiella blandensis (strain CECT 7118 / CCUG 51940 / KCTC 22103 / MED217) TaxID=398720 RepID=A3XIS4_LEEBM|nr:TonB-dependent receptor [Leeuwenhoekiella blandensis]EAQ50547.1 putative outer membrane protein, probably involved in nutrient binding [Leeuwenhoekiella blandensis MED217]